MQAYLSMYELIHSFAFSKTNSRNGFYDRYMGEAIMKMAKGEKADKVMFMNWIQNRLRQDYRKVSENQFVWFTSVLSRWEEEFKIGIYAFSRESNSETLGIIDFLLKNSLNGKVNGKLPVDKLLKSSLTLTDKTMVNPDANPRQLIDAATFILTLYIADTDHEYQHKRKNLLTRLSETPGIHPLSRQAYHLDSLYEFPSE